MRFMGQAWNGQMRLKKNGISTGQHNPQGMCISFKLPDKSLHFIHGAA